MPLVEPESTVSWKQMYFACLAPDHSGDIDLEPDAVRALLAAVGEKSVVATGAALDPRLVINSTGTTVWTALFALALSSGTHSISAVAKGEYSLFVSPAPIRSAFRSHIQWPNSLLEQHPIHPRGASLLVIPFLHFELHPAPHALSHSIRSTDGRLELIHLGAFSDEDPGAFLRDLAALCIAHNDRTAPKTS